MLGGATTLLKANKGAMLTVFVDKSKLTEAEEALVETGLATKLFGANNKCLYQASSRQSLLN